MYSFQPAFSIRRCVVAMFLLALACSCAQAQSSAELCNDDVLRNGMNASYHAHFDKRVLLLAGGFDGGAAGRVRNAIARTASYDEIWLCSGGGLVTEGMAMGRSLAAAQATVRVPDGFTCASSCTIAFMGGFVRFVDPKSRFLVHASSKYKDDFVLRPFLLSCLSNEEQKVCDVLLQVFADSPARCRSANELKDENSQCLVFDFYPNRERKEAIGVRYLAMVVFPEPGLLARPFSSEVVKLEVSATVDLLRYYQEMLLSGLPIRAQGHRYESLKAEFQPVGIYDPANRGQDARSLQDDLRVLGRSDVSGRIALLQSILTDSELTAKRQLVDYIKANGLTFGPASQDSLKILDAMVVCQIQTLCRLSQEEARALGIHNVFDAN